MSQRRKEKCKWKQDVGKDIMMGRVENVVESDWKKKFSVDTYLYLRIMVTINWKGWFAHNDYVLQLDGMWGIF